MNRISRRGKVAIALLIAIPFFAVIGYATYLADSAGKLPWQADPTRITEQLTPFADIPGFSFPTVVPSGGSSAEPTSTATSQPAITGTPTAVLIDVVST